MIVILDSKGKAPLVTSSNEIKANLTYMNVGSAKNKAESIKDYIVHSNVDIMGISESWLYEDPTENATYINAMVPLGYKLIHNPRSDGRVGGGVGIIARNSADIRRIAKSKSSAISKQFEHLECVVRSY